MAGASETKEETLSTFITIAELQRLNERELDLMLRSVLDRLAGYAEGSAERREALATLAMIRRAIALRQAQRPKPGF